MVQLDGFIINLLIIAHRVSNMAKGKPKRDDSGGGTRANQGRGGCTSTKKTGRGRNRR